MPWKQDSKPQELGVFKQMRDEQAYVSESALQGDVDKR